MNRLSAIVLGFMVLIGATRLYGANLEMPAITIAVGGKASLYYLPLTIAEQRGYFRDEGLQVGILDFAGGAKALQAMMGGGADVVSGGFDHVMVMRARGQNLRAFVLQGATPAISLGVAKERAAQYKSPKDLKGMKIGVSAPGSSTHAFINYLLASAGLAPDEVSIIGVGTGPAAVAAMQAGHLDAIANIEPAITMMEKSGTIKIVVETVSVQGASAVYGSPLPSGSLYTREEFIKANPNTVQALTNAMVRALKWLGTAAPDDVAKTVPPEYLLGDRALYLEAYRKNSESYSRDGLFPPAGAEAQLRVLGGFEQAVREAKNLNPADAYTNDFVRDALHKIK
ncbi:MAG TPA: ABC transporter substrate-binding protein [Burkholderiales bacterium]|nr:ABC transporter substrate-binding protein [Burkholderiales bacterium]